MGDFASFCKWNEASVQPFPLLVEFKKALEDKNLVEWFVKTLWASLVGIDDLTALLPHACDALVPSHMRWDRATPHVVSLLANGRAK